MVEDVKLDSSLARVRGAAGGNVPRFEPQTRVDVRQNLAVQPLAAEAAIEDARSAERAAGFRGKVAASQFDSVINNIRERQSLQSEKVFSETALTVSEQVKSFQENATPEQQLTLVEDSVDLYDNLTSERLKGDDLTPFQRQTLKSKFTNYRKQILKSSFDFKANLEELETENAVTESIRLKSVHVQKDPSALEAQLESLQLSLEQQGLNEQQIEAQMQRVAPGLSEVAFNSLVTENPNIAANQLRSGRFDSFVDGDTLQRMSNTLQTASRRQDKKLLDEARTLAKLAESGRRVDPGEVKALVNQTSDPEIAKSISDVAFLVESTQGINLLPLREQAQTIERFRNRADDQNLSPDARLLAQQVLNHANKVAKKKREAFNQGRHVEWFESTGQMPEVNLSFGAGTGDLPAKMDERRESLEILMEAEGASGAPPMTPDEIELFANVYEEANIEQRNALMEEFNSALDENEARTLLPKIAKGSAAPVAIVNNRFPSPVTKRIARDINAGSDAIKEERFVMPSDSAIQGVIDKNIGEFRKNALSSAALKHHREGIKALMVKKLIDDGANPHTADEFLSEIESSGVLSDSVVNESIAEIIGPELEVNRLSNQPGVAGSAATLGGLIPLGGTTFKTLSFRKDSGKWATEDDINELMDSLDENALRQAGGDVPHLLNREGKLEPISVERVRNMSLELVGDGKYRLLSPDNNSEMALSPDGTSYKLNMRELIDIFGDPGSNDPIDSLRRDILEAAQQ